MFILQGNSSMRLPPFTCTFTCYISFGNNSLHCFTLSL